MAAFPAPALSDGGVLFAATERAALEDGDLEALAGPLALVCGRAGGVFLAGVFPFSVLRVLMGTGFLPLVATRGWDNGPGQRYRPPIPST
jgi:glucokinase